GPLVRRSERNFAELGPGDLAGLGRALPTIAGWTVTPTSIALLTAAAIERLSAAFGDFAVELAEARARARARLQARGASGSSVDFVLRHGVSVSSTLRVRALERCIECGACEEACAERYGAKRLSLGGRLLGALDFVDACHTCTDARCIDPCKFDAI